MVKNGENVYGESGREIGKFLHFSPFFTMNTSPMYLGALGKYTMEAGLTSQTKDFLGRLAGCNYLTDFTG